MFGQGKYNDLVKERGSQGKIIYGDDPLKVCVASVRGVENTYKHPVGIFPLKTSKIKAKYRFRALQRLFLRFGDFKPKFREPPH